jgi:hypothetical protein
VDQGRRFYTLPEANLKVPGLEKRFGEIALRVDRARTLDDQINDLEIAWGAKVLEESCPERADYLRYRKEAEEVHEGIRGDLATIAAEGIEIKDPDTGLIDFYAKRGAEVVYLCWRKGEKEIGFWHTLQGGFAGRKPIREF